MLRTSMSHVAKYAIPVIGVFVPGTASSAQVYYYPTPSGSAYQATQMAQPLVGPTVTLDASDGAFSDTAEAATWLEASSGKVLSYLETQDGWKGEGSLAPSRQAISEALDLLEQFAFEAPTLPAPLISGDDEGSLSFFWNDESLLASIFVYGDGTYSFFAESFEHQVRSDEETIGDIIPPRLLQVMLRHGTIHSMND